ncbi:MAG: SoxR reducing system RseC family protein [Eubacteriales bacterium]|nr:SoxR reducing system RseC family protein [Eubacteriales bacterium]
MKQTAQVIVRDGRLVGRVERPEACMKCRACDYGLNAETIVELPKGSWQEGDLVELDLERGRLSKASLWAYGVPLAGLLAGLVLGGALGVGELWQAALGLLGALAGFGVLRLMEPRLRGYRPKITPCAMNWKGEDEDG